MSTQTYPNVEGKGFASRLVEACGTSEPAEISRKLKIPYQSVRNYLSGRLPAADVLISIASSTNVSIHWLLTGEGSKRVHYEPSDVEPIEAEMGGGRGISPESRRHLQLLELFPGSASDIKEAPDEDAAARILDVNALIMLMRNVVREEIGKVSGGQLQIDMEHVSRELVEDLGSVGGEAQTSQRKGGKGNAG